MPLKLKDYLIIGDVDKEGDVEIEIDNGEACRLYEFINQNELKQLIEHLQKQLIT